MAGSSEAFARSPLARGQKWQKAWPSHYILFANYEGEIYVDKQVMLPRRGIARQSSNAAAAAFVCLRQPLNKPIQCGQGIGEREALLYLGLFPLIPRSSASSHRSSRSAPESPEEKPERADSAACVCVWHCARDRALALR